VRQHAKKEVAACWALERCYSVTTAQATDENVANETRSEENASLDHSDIQGTDNVDYHLKIHAECRSGIHRMYGETMLKLVSIKDLQYSDPRLVLIAVA
jgi:hypothetical protein